jgi:hypothetical protein
MKEYNFRVVNKRTGNYRFINMMATSQTHAINKSKFYLKDGEVIVY